MVDALLDLLAAWHNAPPFMSVLLGKHGLERFLCVGILCTSLVLPPKRVLCAKTIEDRNTWHRNRADILQLEIRLQPIAIKVNNVC